VLRAPLLTTDTQHGDCKDAGYGLLLTRFDTPRAQWVDGMFQLRCTHAHGIQMQDQHTHWCVAHMTIAYRCRTSTRIGMLQQCCYSHAATSLPHWNTSPAGSPCENPSCDGRPVALQQCYPALLCMTPWCNCRRLDMPCNQTEQATKPSTAGEQVSKQGRQASEQATDQNMYTTEAR
jgi:hypothetical protein